MKKLLLVLVGVLALLSLAVIALAVTPTVKSEGAVSGTGSGLAHARIFQGSVTVTGAGTLHVSPKAQVKVTSGTLGEKTTRTDKHGKQSWTRYTHFSGTAVVTGQDVHVLLRGKNITLSATGAGRAHFIGQGTFTLTNAGQSEKKGTWTQRPKHSHEQNLNFWHSVRVVFGNYTFKNGKDDEAGDIIEAMLD